MQPGCSQPARPGAAVITYLIRRCRVGGYFRYPATSTRVPLPIATYPVSPTWYPPAPGWVPYLPGVSKRVSKNGVWMMVPVLVRFSSQVHSFYKSFVIRMWDQMSTKRPIVPLLLAIVSLFTCNGTLGFHSWMHQSKKKGGQPGVEIMCTDYRFATRRFVSSYLLNAGAILMHA